MIISMLGLLAAATMASLAASTVIVLSQRWHGKHTLDHDLDGVQKIHTVAVPRIGGLAVFFGLAVGLLAAGLLKIQLGVGGVFPLLLASLPAFFAGIVEDLTKKVSVRARLLASIASALAASWLLGATVARLDVWGVDALLTWTPVAMLVTAVVVAGGVNAINIIDGFNGLSGAAVMVMLAALGAVSWQAGDTFVLALAVVGIGATLGFLLRNYPTGHLFLGDGGAYLLGFWVSEVAVLLLVRNGSVNAWRVLSICAYPIIEVLYSIYRRRIVRQASPGSPDGLHLHTLVYRRIVWRFVSHEAARPWKRNAVVACVIVPWIALAGLLSVLAGKAIVASVALVVGQTFAYIAVYARLVRGQWGIRPALPATRALVQDGPLRSVEHSTAVVQLAAVRLSKHSAKSADDAEVAKGPYLGDDGFGDKYGSVS